MCPLRPRRSERVQVGSRNLTSISAYSYKVTRDPGEDAQALMRAKSTAQRKLEELIRAFAQRSSWGFPVRADSRAASNISMTCTFSCDETGSSIGLFLRMQSTK